MAADAVLGPGQGLQAFRRDRLAARAAEPELAGLDPLERALDQPEMQRLTLPQLLPALAFGDFGGRGRLSPVRDARVLDLLGELEADARLLGFERPACVFDKLRVHGSHPTPLAHGVRPFSTSCGKPSERPEAPVQQRTAC